MKSLLIILLALLMLLSACEKEQFEGALERDTQLAADLRASPDTLLIGDFTLYLQAYLWRDFMPPAEENGSKMNCLNKLTESGAAALPESIVLEHQYVIKGDEVWFADYNETRREEAHIIEGLVRNGPKWGPDIAVDVVSEFSYNGTRYRIIARDQNIDKTS